MTDLEWAQVRSLLPVPGWLCGRGGRPEGYRHRAMLDAIRYLVDNGGRFPGTSRRGTRGMRSFAGGVTMAWSGSSMTGCVDRSARSWAATRSRRQG
jgi:hypothetical protein